MLNPTFRGPRGKTTGTNSGLRRRSGSDHVTSQNSAGVCVCVCVCVCLEEEEEWIRSRDFTEFSRKIEDPRAGPLREMIQSFVEAFLLKRPKITDHKMVTRVWFSCLTLTSVI